MCAVYSRATERTETIWFIRPGYRDQSNRVRRESVKFVAQRLVYHLRNQPASSKKGLVGRGPKEKKSPRGMKKSSKSRVKSLSSLRKFPYMNKFWPKTRASFHQ